MTTLKTVALAATTALATSIPVHSAEIVGVGTRQCSDFLRAASAANPEDAAAYVSWANGFMSALNLSREQRQLQTKRFPRGTKPAAPVFEALVAFCKSQPAKDFALATIDTYRHLSTVSTKK